MYCRIFYRELDLFLLLVKVFLLLMNLLRSDWFGCIGSFGWFFGIFRNYIGFRIYRSIGFCVSLRLRVG